MSSATVFALGCLLVACAYDPVGSCQGRCQEAVARGCRAEDTDCVDVCAGEQEAYDAQRMEAERLGCTVEYDALIACQAAADACATSPCLSASADQVRCVQAFCADHASDPACSM